MTALRRVKRLLRRRIPLWIRDELERVRDEIIALEVENSELRKRDLDWMERYGKTEKGRKEIPF